PIRIGKTALHELLTTWLARLEPGGAAYLVVQRHLGSDSLQRWLEESGWPAERFAARAGYRVLRVAAAGQAGGAGRGGGGGGWQADDSAVAAQDAGTGGAGANRGQAPEPVLAPAGPGQGGAAARLGQPAVQRGLDHQDGRGVRGGAGLAVRRHRPAGAS